MRLVNVTVVLVGLALLAAGCGGDDEESATAPTTASTPSAAETTAAETPAATETTAAAETPAAETSEASPDSTARPDTDDDGSPDVATFRGKVGDTFILVGQPGYKEAAKDAVRVTVHGIIGPFSGFDLAKGQELIGVEVTFEGVGDEVYENPQPHGELTLDSGETGKQTSLISGSNKNPCDNKSLELKKGEKVKSCLAFEIPTKDKPKVFQYAASSGYGDTGIWRLGG